MSRPRTTSATKSVIAGVACGALLLGTGATFALWSDSAELTGATITTGRLSLEAANFVWEYQNSNDAPNDWTAIGDGSAYLMIPGQTVRGTFSITGEFAGTDLTATLTASGTATETDNIPGSTITWTAGDVSVQEFEPGDISVTVDGSLEDTWVVTIALPVSTVGDNAANNAFAPEGTTYQWSLSDLSFTLTQDLLT